MLQFLTLSEQGPKISQANDTALEYKAVFAFSDPDDPDALSMKENDYIWLEEKISEDWGYGCIESSGARGYFPFNRTVPLLCKKTKVSIGYHEGPESELRRCSTISQLLKAI
jgi:hypothetical protein